MKFIVAFVPPYYKNASFNMDFSSLIALAMAGFVASFVDSVVGGGGLISIPALLMTGMPPSMALGTNKVAASLSSATSTIAFVRSGKINPELLKRLVPFTFVAACLGAYTVQKIPPTFLKPFVVAMLVAVAIYTFLRKEWGVHSTYLGLDKRVLVLGCLLAASMGFYDGFFGPGTGSFLIFGLLFLGFDFLGAAANAKVLNFTSNIASVLVFVAGGQVVWQVAGVMGASMILGAIFGTQVAIRKGATYVRPMFLLIVALMIAKQIWTMIGP
jgi:uncharacterized protein